MTPMSRLKNNIDTFSGLLSKDFKEIVLNKSRPKTHSFHQDGEVTGYVEDIGVKSDFIKIFKAQFNAKNTFSMAFSFTYIDLPESEQKAQYTLKFMSDYPHKPIIVASEDMSINQFKTKLNEVNALIANLGENATYDNIIDTVSTHFIEDFSNHINCANKVNNNAETFKKIKIK